MKTFKTIWITAIALLGFLALCNAQDNSSDKFTLGIKTEALDNNTHNDSYDYGFNAGVELQYQMERFYIKPTVFYAPTLNNIPYFDFDVRVGIHWRSKRDESRIFLGGLIGAINREGWGHGKIGAELGYEIYFNNAFYAGLYTDYQYKHDDKIWRNNASGHSVVSCGLTLGIIL